MSLPWPIRTAAALSLLPLLCCASSAPPAIFVQPPAQNDGWPVSSLEAEGMDPAPVAALERQIDAGVFVAPDAIVIARHGKLVYESYRNGFDRDELHDLRSATKSITSLLVGAAIDRGLVLGVNERVLPFFPEHTRTLAPSEAKSRMRLRDLLTMSPGLDCNDWIPASPGNEERMYKTKDWIAFALGLSMTHEPGQYTAYCTAGPVLLGGVLTKATGQPVPDFANAALFSALSITRAEWQKTPEGGTDTGGHIHLRPRDLLKFGQLVVEGGRWQGRELVSPAWIEESTRDHTSLGGAPYGYLWWLGDFNTNGTSGRVISAQGNGAQYAFAVPSLDLAVAFTGSRYNDPSNGQPYELLRRYVIEAAVAGGG